MLSKHKCPSCGKNPERGDWQGTILRGRPANVCAICFSQAELQRAKALCAADVRFNGAWWVGKARNWQVQHRGTAAYIHPLDNQDDRMGDEKAEPWLRRRAGR